MPPRDSTSGKDDSGTGRRERRRYNRIVTEKSDRYRERANGEKGRETQVIRARNEEAGRE